MSKAIGSRSKRDRLSLVAEAKTWLGTPYCHQAALKSVGCDCLGLLRGLWRWIEGAEPEAVPAYASTWSVAAPNEALLEAASRNFNEVAPNKIAVGDVLIFRMRKGAPANHVGLLTAQDTFIHAYEGNGVVETRLSPAWQKRVAATFCFPQIDQDTSR